VREGQWQLLDREPPSNGDASWRQLVAFSWERADRRLLVVAQGYVRPRFFALDGSTWRLTELLDPTIRYERDGAELARRGLYVDLPRWRPTVFALTPAGR
jgi:hypothetical protein